MHPYFSPFCIVIAVIVGFLLIHKANSILREARVVLDEASRGGDFDEDGIKGIAENTPYIPRNVIAVVTRNFSGADENTTNAIKALVEAYPKRITGLETSFTSGNAAVIFKHSEPYFVWPENRAKTVIGAVERWLRQQQEQQQYPDPRGIDVIFFEPDITYTTVVDSWHCKSMTFNEVQSYQGTRDVEFIGITPEVHVKFTTLETERGSTINKLAQDILDQFNRDSDNPNEPEETADDYKVFSIGEIDLDDKNATYALRHNMILVPIGVFVGVLDDIDHGYHMGNSQPETRQEKLDDLLENLRSQESDESQEIPPPAKVSDSAEEHF